MMTQDLLTEDEYWAVYDYINGHKDEWGGAMKEGMLKLLNGYDHARLRERTPELAALLEEIPLSLAEAGRMGGSVKSARKATTSAANGKLGGRPGKNPL